jgi:Predicted membrane protein
MSAVFWILQWLFGLYFISIGVLHFIVPPGLPEAMAWMYDLSPTLHVVSGTFEILGGLGLLLPALTKRAVFLVPLAALGLAGVMIAAMIWHIQHGTLLETGPMNVIVALIMVFLAWGRWKLRPHVARVPA